MDIVSVASSFPRHRRDPSGRFIFDLDRGLAERGHRVLQLAPEAEGAAALEGFHPGWTVRRFPFTAAAWQRKIAYGHGIGANLKRKPWLVGATPALFFGMRRALDEALTSRPDAVVLSHWAIPAGAVAAAAAEHFRRPHVSIMHGGGVQVAAALPGGRIVLRHWARRTQGLIAVSRDLAEKARRALGPEGADRNIRVQAMGLDLAAFRPSGHALETREHLGIEADQYCVVGAGRHLEIKGYDLLVAAMADIPNAVLVLAGEGPETENLRVQAKSLGVDLRLPGRLDPHELSRLFEAADVFVAPSRLGPKGRSEGAPVVIPEAFAAGLCVVASRTGGIVESVTEGETGLLFESEDIEALKNHLLRLQDDEDLRHRMSQTAFARAEDWDYTRVAAAVEEVLLAAQVAHGGKR